MNVVRFLEEQTIKTLLFLTLSLFILASCGKKDGIAPGLESIPPADAPPVASQTYEVNFKYGETKLTNNNWEVSFDSTDSIEEKLLVSGWAVEANYE